MMANLPHFIQYQGSKRNLAKYILHFLPKNINRLVEPFSGTAALSVATSASQIAHSFWLNDLNKPLIELLELAIERPDEIADFYLEIWNKQHADSVAHYFEIRSRFNKTHDPRLFLYLLARCVKGSVRYNSEGLFNQSPDKRRKGTRPETMRKNIAGVSRLLQGKCKFSSLDYREVLAQVQEGDFVYMDPPYQGVSGSRDSRYLSGINFDDFVLVLDQLNQKGIAFAISYDGRLGHKSFGKILPKSLELERIEIEVGRSTQSTLLGKAETTVESLYLSPSLSRNLIDNHEIYNFSDVDQKSKQLTLLENNSLRKAWRIHSHDPMTCLNFVDL
jgi:DNA adenine methylase